MGTVLVLRSDLQSVSNPCTVLLCHQVLIQSGPLSMFYWFNNLLGKETVEFSLNSSSHGIWDGPGFKKIWGLLSCPHIFAGGPLNLPSSSLCGNTRVITMLHTRYNKATLGYWKSITFQNEKGHSGLFTQGGKAIEFNDHVKKCIKNEHKVGIVTEKKGAQIKRGR